MRIISGLGLASISSLLLLLYVLVYYQPIMHPYDREKKHKQLMFEISSRQEFLIKSGQNTENSNPWSGNYTSSVNGKLIVNLENRRFVRQVYSGFCQLLDIEHYVGSVKIDHGKIKLIYQTIDGYTPPDNINELTPVIWGDRYHLVPSSKMTFFLSSLEKTGSHCNYWDGCDESWITLSGHEKEVYGIPKIVSNLSGK